MKSSVLSPASFFDKVVIWLLVLSQILKTYGTVSYWNFASIPTYILGLVFLFLVISKKRTFRLGTSMPKECFIFFAYWAIVHILTNQGSVIPYNTIEAALMFVLFWGVVTYEQFPRLVKYYTWTAWVCIAFFAVQEITFRTSGIRISGIFSVLPIALNEVSDASSFIVNKMTSDRGAAFFSEPAYLSQYLMPLLAISLFNKKDKKYILKSVIIVITIFLTASGTGIIAIGAVLAVYMLYLMTSKSIVSKLFVMFLFIGTFIFVPYFLNTEIGEKMLSRQSELSFEYDSGSRSGFMRLYRGLYVYDDYSVSEKIFGNDNNAAIKEHISHSVFAFTFADDNDTFFNGVQYTLLRTGLIGLLIMIMLHVRIFKQNNSCGRAILMGFVTLMFMEAVFFGNNMILYLIFAERFKNNAQLLEV